MKKHILCFGDSNTYGFCADPKACADGGIRFNEEERWTCLLQKALGDHVLVTEEGLPGRTCVFDDPLTEGMNGLNSIYGLLKSHEMIDLLVIMLGTNDTKERFAANTYAIAKGMDRLCRKAISIDCWRDGKPNILIVSPPPIGKGVEHGIFAEEMGMGCAEKCEKMGAYYAQTAELLGLHFLDAAGCEFNTLDYMHLTREGHRHLADLLAKKISSIL